VQEIITFAKCQRLRKALCGLRAKITETKQKTDLGRALVNITKICCTSPKLNGNDEDWLKVLTVKSVSQNPQCNLPQHG
jgi:hypothetical protein